MIKILFFIILLLQSTAFAGSYNDYTDADKAKVDAIASGGMSTMAKPTSDDNEYVMKNGAWAIMSESGGAVTSVNGETGAVVLDTDNITEGVTNLYDQTVAITGDLNVTIGGTYPNFTITFANGSGYLTSITGNEVAFTGWDKDASNDFGGAYSSLSGIPSTFTPTDSSVTTTKFSAATLVIESEGIAANDNDTTIPTSAAVKDAIDAVNAGLADGDYGDITVGGSGTTINVDSDALSDEYRPVFLADEACIYRGATAPDAAKIAEYVAAGCTEANIQWVDTSDTSADGRMILGYADATALQAGVPAASGNTGYFSLTDDGNLYISNGTEWGAVGSVAPTILLYEEFVNLTNWTNVANTTATTESGRTVAQMTPTASNAIMHHTLSTFPTSLTVTLVVNNATLGTEANANMFQIVVCKNTTEYSSITWRDDGLFAYVSSFDEIGTNVTEAGSYITWEFVFDFSGATTTVDVYKTGALVASGVPSHATSSGLTAGQIRFFQYKGSAAITTYIDSITVE